MLKNIINILNFVLFVFFKSIFKRRKRIDSDSDLIIISNFGMGDLILMRDFLNALLKQSEKSKKKLYILTNSSSAKMLENNLGISGYIPLEESTDGIFLFWERCSKSIKETKNKYRKYNFDNVYVMGVFNILAPATVAILSINANRKYMWFKQKEYLGFIKRIIRRVNYFFMKNAITNPIFLPKESSFLEYWHSLSERIGLTDKNGVLEHCPVSVNSNKHYFKNPYVSFSLDSSESIRRWDIEKFAYLAEKIIEKYGFDIALLGTNIETEDCDNAFAFLNSTGKIHNFVKKTTFDELAEIISHAEFHLGVDSGSIHLAADLGVKSFCLVGAWDMYLFYPYSTALISSDIKSPVPIYCNYLNPLDKKHFGCDKCIKKNECPSKDGMFLCISSIGIDDVMKKIDEHYRSENTDEG